MTDRPFQKLSENITIDWNLNSMLSNFGEDIVDKVYGNQRHLPVLVPSQTPRWQIFPSGIAFARNFPNYFKAECEHVANTLNALRATISPESKLGLAFKMHEFIPQRVNMIRISPGERVEPHIDVTRSIVVNIGLVNSSSCVTYMGMNSNIKDFDAAPKTSYTMNDGDIYILDVQKVHAVHSLTTKDSGVYRYLITYTLENFDERNKNV